jgi:hypothetical protein
MKDTFTQGVSLIKITGMLRFLHGFASLSPIARWPRQPLYKKKH